MTSEGAPPAGHRRLTDPRAMRALAHPVRVALLEALAHAGTLTATQASELLGESPANCAFHLRTLAKYGFVEEAGGGRGRERPWRRAHEVLNLSTDQDDPAAAMAAAEFASFWLDMVLNRARSALGQEKAWPAAWRGGPLGPSQYVMYLTPEEARDLEGRVHDLFQQYYDRMDHPERRPADAIPVEVLLLAYPLLHLAGLARPAARRETED